MTIIKDGMVVIAVQAPKPCEMCGKVAECRPYGPGGKNICFECGELDREGIKQRMAAVFKGEPVV